MNKAFVLTAEATRHKQCFTKEEFGTQKNKNNYVTLHKFTCNMEKEPCYASTVLTLYKIASLPSSLFFYPVLVKIMGHALIPSFLSKWS